MMSRWLSRQVEVENVPFPNGKVEQEVGVRVCAAAGWGSQLRQGLWVGGWEV